MLNPSYIYFNVTTCRCDHTGDRPARARLQVVAQYQLKDIPTPTARAVLRLLSRLVGTVYIVAPSGE